MALYALKYANCFENPLEVEHSDSNVESLSEEIRNEGILTNILKKQRRATWNKTIHSNNTVPSYHSIALRTQRLLYSVKKVFQAVTPMVESWDMLEWGWMDDGSNRKIQVFRDFFKHPGDLPR